MTPQVQAKKKIVFLAGPKNHGAIETTVLVGKAPRDLKVLEDTSAIVIVGSGDWLRNETTTAGDPARTQ